MIDVKNINTIDMELINHIKEIRKYRILIKTIKKLKENEDEN